MKFKKQKFNFKINLLIFLKFFKRRLNLKNYNKDEIKYYKKL